MWALWILTALIAASGYVIVSNEVKSPVVSARASADLAWNLGVYRAAVIQYASAHPSFSGAVPDEALTFPSWYKKHDLWANQVAGKTIAVYATRPLTAELAAEVVALSKNSLLAGVADAKRGMLYSPIYGATDIPIPASIPDGVAVWLAYPG